mgnify:CR=1 FL=1
MLSPSLMVGVVRGEEVSDIVVVVVVVHIVAVICEGARKNTKVRVKIPGSEYHSYQGLSPQ